MAVGTAAGEAEPAQFHILGPLEVVRSGCVVPLGGRRQRAVLALLLLQANRAVPVDRLAEDVWGGHPPPGSVTTLQSYVFRLRRALEPDRPPGAAGAVLVTRDRGYLVRVKAGHLDAAVFEDGFTAGRAALEAGRYSEAAQALRTALGLWRGPVLADLADYAFIQREAVRLEELRLAALEARIDADLALGRHDALTAELTQLVADHPLRERLHGQLMLALYRCGRQADALAAYGRVRDLLAGELGIDPGEPLQRLHGSVLAHDPALNWKPGRPAPAKGHRASPSASVASPPPEWPPRRLAGSPYRGLAVFGERDAGWFFGREAAAAALLDRMSRLLAGTGLLVVSGASGAGKSSLLRAGVLPRIRAEGLAAAPGAAAWPQVVFTPTQAPLDELALRVAPLAGADAAAVRRGLAADPGGFALTARQAARAGAPRPPDEELDGASAPRDQLRPGRLLLVVDQFEELFTQCPDEGQRRAFISALHAAATAGHGPDQPPAALVVLGVRADFEVRCANYPQLAGPVQDRYLVTAMTERQLRMAITEPAKKAGSTVDDDLTGLLLAEARTSQPGTFGAGVLPLLSHALDQAWRCRTGEALTLADYERTGGIEGAVAASAQRAYDGLTPAQQATARQVFLRLTATSSDGMDTADRATRAELTDGKSAAEALDVETVLEAFTAERLLTLTAGTVELSHEVLLTAWPLLRDTWLADTHADRIVRTRLHHTAAEWAHQSRDASYLYGGSLLQAATDTAARIGADPGRHPPLSQTERDFLHASDRAHRRTVRRRRRLIALLTALVLGFAAATVLAIRASQQVAQQRDIAIAGLLISQSQRLGDANPALSRLLSVAAWRLNPSGAARYAMLAAAARRPGI